MWWPNEVLQHDGPRLEEATDLPDWYYVGLVVVVGGFWLTAYVLAIFRANLDGRNGIPLVAVGFNIAWEFNNSFIVEHSEWQRPFNFAWFLLDIYIVMQVLRFGRKDYPNLTAWEFKRMFFGTILFAAFFLPAVELDINDDYGAYTGLGVNAAMSLAFLMMLRRRGSSAGQSMYIALSKGIGSLLGVQMSISLYPESGTIYVMGAAVIVLDTAYCVLLYQQIRREGESPWRFNRPKVEAASEGDEGKDIRVLSRQ